MSAPYNPLAIANDFIEQFGVVNRSMTQTNNQFDVTGLTENRGRKRNMKSR